MRYRPGQRVRVASRSHEGHHRTPSYVKGKTGRVEIAHGSFPNPETRAYGDDGLPTMPVYLVSFAEAELWSDYRGHAGDRLYIDLAEHWLEETE